MRRMLKTVMVLTGLLLSTFLWAQDRTVSGKVVDDQDLPLPGATVRLKDTQIGVPTDQDGKYRISVPSEGGILIFQFLGFEDQEIEVGNQSEINVKMVPEIIDIGTEVVVTALGIQKEKERSAMALRKLTGKNSKRSLRPM